MKRSWLGGLALLGLQLLFTAHAVSQIQIARPLAPPVARPLLAVNGATDQPIELRTVRIDTSITGTFAHTRIEMRFFNPNARILEGELQFPLTGEQTIVGFAMDVDGNLRDAVPVEKPRAQAVFEDITRAQIDPGLLQVTQGNNFKLRVYPIPPRGEKIVQLRLIEPLILTRGTRVFQLPLDYVRAVESFSLSIQAPQAKATPRVVREAVPGLRFAAVGDQHVARVEAQRFTASGALEIALDAAGASAAQVGTQDGKTYFYAEVPFQPKRSLKPAPRVLGLIWDSSGSAAQRDRTKELAFLDALFRRVPNVEVRLTRLRDQVEPAESFRVANGNWSELRASIDATPYDGATNFGAFEPDRTTNEYVLFSDGLTNFGEGSLSAMKVPVHTVASAHKSDATALRHIAHRSGGRFIDLTATSASESVSTILSAEERIASLTSNGATDLVAASPFARNGILAVAGVLTEPRATVRVQLAGLEQTRAITLDIDAAQRAESFAPWLWARLRLAALEGDYATNRGEIRRIGKAFGLPTRETSLIILDRVEDYARFEIDPPAELRADYQRLRSTMAKRTDDQKRAQIERIVRLLVQKEAWWQRDFPKDGRPMPIAKARPEQASADRQGERRERDRLNQLPERARESVERRAAPAEMLRQDSSPRPVPSAPPAAASAPGVSSPIGGTFNGALADRSALSKAASNNGATNAIAIQLKPWSPDAPYAKRLREADAADLYKIYLDERPSYASSTAFFLDVADLFFAEGLHDVGLRVLSNLAEMNLENRHILRILGLRLLQAQQPKLAVAVFKKVLELSPEEPQSYRDLGLAYAANGQAQQAIDALYEVVERPWHGRFPEVELIALAELNAIRENAKAPLDTTRMDPRLLKNLPLDLRVVLAWDADNTDIDLWVTDPNAEKAFYGHRLTYQGGRMSADFTGGYGPEEFSLKFAKPGKYKIEAQFYGHRQQIVAGATTLALKLSTKFGTPAQQDQLVTLRLKGQSEVVYVGEFEVK